MKSGRMKSGSWLRLLLISFLLLKPEAVQAQQGAWNDPAAIEVVNRGILRRATEVVDTALHTYSADARGYIYFLLDAPDLGRQTLVRTDQVAVEVYWRSPNEVRQRIVGMREQRELPVTRLYYYLDRLTVVQDNYDQGIVIADGENVNDVPHPVSSGADEFYDYRLADSVQLNLPGMPGPVKVHEIEVRPRNPSHPAVVGSVFLEGETGALVRMSFSFTPAAYLDERLDYIHVTLENGLWQGKYWLPYEQRLEIRREMPELDLPFGTIIRTRMRINDYIFNEPVPEWLFQNRLAITMAPRAQREAFPFEEPIEAEWDLEGLGQPIELAELRREAQRIITQRALSGLPVARPGGRSASDILRYNRAEGLAAAFGIGFNPSPGAAARLQAGWAFGPGHPLADASVTVGARQPVTATTYMNRPGDVGGFEPNSGLVNTFGSFFFGQDWRDPYFTSGGTLSTPLSTGSGWTISPRLSVERQRSARLTTRYSLFGGDGAVRPVRPVDDGTAVALAATLSRPLAQPSGGFWTVQGTVSRLDGDAIHRIFGQLRLDLGYVVTRPSNRLRLELDGTVAASAGEIPRQNLFLLGGRGSLPGFEHRSFVGDRFALIRATGSADIVNPWIRGRVSVAAGSTQLSSAGEEAARAWGAATEGGIHPSVGVGVGIFYDILRVDVIQGFGPGGRSQVVVEVSPTFWDFL